MKVLVVDDSRTTRMIEKEILKSLGFSDILEANHGEEALSIIQNDKPDLILLDWKMPVMDGLTFIKKFREIDHDTPVIMVSTEVCHSSVQQAVIAGINNYVTKPFLPKHLKKRIDETMDKKSMMLEAA